MSEFAKKLASLFGKDKRKKLVRGATGQDEPYERPKGKEVRESQNERLKRMAKESDKNLKKWRLRKKRK